MATNDFLPYAVGAGANVLSQSAYAALTTLLANGLQSGIVSSNQLNKTLRQPSIMAAVIGQLIADATGQNAVDDGTIATLEANLARVIRGAASYATDSGSANAYAITLSPAPASLVAGMTVSFIAGNTNTGASTLTVNGTSKSLNLRGSVALLAGDIQAGSVVRAQYDGTQWQALNPATASRLIGTPTNDSPYTGYVGEIISSTVVQGSAVALTDNIAANLTSIVLTPGDWTLYGNVMFTPAASTSITQLCGATSPTSGVVNDLSRFQSMGAAYVPTAINQIGSAVPEKPIKVPSGSTATYYLVAYARFTVSTLGAYGQIWARRER